MFVSVRVLITRTENGDEVELTMGDRHRGSFTFFREACLPSIGSAYHADVILRAPEAKKAAAKPKRRQQISRKQEEKLAESLGGQRHYGSGNKTGYEGDVRVTGKYRVECKYTSKKSRVLSRSEIGKLRSECSLGEAPMINIQFRNPETLAVEEDWICVPRNEWEKHATTDD